MRHAGSRVGHRPHRIASHAVLIVLIGLSLYPFLFLLMTSLKSNDQFYHGYFSPAFPLQWGNYAEAWGQIAGYFPNSISITLVSVASGLLLSALAAWAFARYRFPGSGILYAAVLLVLLIPGVLTLIPAFVILRDLGLMGTHGALYAVYVTESLILGIVILRGFFSALPEELVEAASLDGAGEAQVVARIALPLTKPAFLTVAIMNALACWNDYIWPLILLPDTRLWTVTLGLVSFRDRYAGMAAWGPLFAGFVIASVPLFLLFLTSMRSFLSGLTSGALKA